MTKEQQLVNSVHALYTMISLLGVFLVGYLWVRSLRESRLDKKIYELDARLDRISRKAFNEGFKGFNRDAYFELQKRVWLVYGNPPSLGLTLYILLRIFRRRYPGGFDYVEIAHKVRDLQIRQEYLQVYEELLGAIGKRLVSFDFLAKRLKHVDILLVHYLVLGPRSKFVEAD